MRYYVIFLILSIGCFSSVCSAADISVEELIQGVNQARKTIQSGEIHTDTIEEIPATKTTEEIDAEMKKKIEEELKTFVPHDGVDVDTYKNDYLIPNLKFFYGMFSGYTEERHATTLFQIIDTDTDGYHELYHYKLTIEQAPGLSLHSILAQNHNAGLIYFLGTDLQTQVKLDIGNIVTYSSFLPQAVTLFDYDEYFGYGHYSMWGRSHYRITAGAKYVGKDSFDGTECHVLEFPNVHKQRTKIWVDDSIDFCIRKIEIFRTVEKKHISFRAVYKDYRKYNNVWFPVITEETQFKKDGTVSSHEVTKVTSALFNVDFPKDFFKVDKNLYGPPGVGVLPGFGASPSSPSSEEENLLLLCGPQSLLYLCELLRVKTNLQELKKLSGFDPIRGTTMKGIKEAATYKGLSPIGVRTSLELLKRKKVQLPAIAYVDDNHFLVFESVDKDGVKISDPAKKYDPYLTWDEISEIWGGQLLIVDKKKRGKQKQVPLAFADAPVYDFGKVLGGGEIKHTFTIKNIGQKPLKIVSVTETCACTASILTKDEILPGKTGKVLSVLKVPSENRLIQENILIHTDDPVQNTLKLTLKGEAYLPLTTFPELLAIGTHKSLQIPLEKRVSLHLQEGVKILGVRTDSKYMKAELITVENIPMANLQLMPSLPVGKFSQHLLVDYDYKGEKTTHNIYIYGEILGDIHVTPNRLFFGLVKDTSSFSKTITIASLDTQPFEITSMESSTKSVKVTVTKHQNEKSYQLITTISPEAKSGEVSGEVVIHTSSTIQPTVRVPFFGIIADVK